MAKIFLEMKNKILAIFWTTGRIVQKNAILTKFALLYYFTPFFTILYCCNANKRHKK